MGDMPGMVTDVEFTRIGELWDILETLGVNVRRMQRKAKNPARLLVSLEAEFARRKNG